MSYNCALVLPWARTSREASGKPAAAPTAMTLRNSRRFTSLVDGRRGIHQQCDDVLDLLFGEDAVMAETRHVGAGRVRIGIEYFAVGVALNVGAIAPRLGELIQTRANRAVRNFFRIELMTRVAIGAHRTFRIIGVLHAATFLRDPLAIFPVAEILAVGRPFDGRKIGFLD